MAFLTSSKTSSSAPRAAPTVNRNVPIRTVRPSLSSTAKSSASKVSSSRSSSGGSGGKSTGSSRTTTAAPKPVKTAAQLIAAGYGAYSSPVLSARAREGGATLSGDYFTLAGAPVTTAAQSQALAKARAAEEAARKASTAAQQAETQRLQQVANQQLAEAQKLALQREAIAKQQAALQALRTAEAAAAKKTTPSIATAVASGAFGQQPAPQVNIGTAQAGGVVGLKPQAAGLFAAAPTGFPGVPQMIEQATSAGPVPSIFNTRPTGFPGVPPTPQETAAAVGANIPGVPTRTVLPGPSLMSAPQGSTGGVMAANLPQGFFPTPTGSPLAGALPGPQGQGVYLPTILKGSAAGAAPGLDYSTLAQPERGQAAETARLTGLAEAMLAGQVPLDPYFMGGDEIDATLSGIPWVSIGPFGSHAEGVAWADAYRQKYGKWPWEGDGTPEENLYNAMAEWFGWGVAGELPPLAEGPMMPEVPTIPVPEEVLPPTYGTYGTPTTGYGEQNYPWWYSSQARGI